MNREQAALVGYAEHWSTPPAGASDAADLARTEARGRDAAAEGALASIPEAETQVELTVQAPTTTFHTPGRMH